MKEQMRQQGMTKDMTKGSPTKLILGFSIPMLFGMLFQQFYNLVDAMIVGKILGVNALAGVGATGSINFLIIGFSMGVCGGFGISIAQQFGAKKFNELRCYLFNIYVLSIVFSLTLTLISVVFCKDILRLMKTPESIFAYSYQYIVIILIGIPTVFLYNIVSNVICALGDSKTPVVFLVMSAVINIILDFVFILHFKMGVAGAAWATNLSQLISGLSCLYYMNHKYEVIKLEKQEQKIESRYMLKLCMNGVPMGLQYSITAIGSVILQSSVNNLGASYVAATTAGSKLFLFFCSPFNALGATMSTYAGQNVGAGALKRVTKGVISAIVIGSIYSVFSLVLLHFITDYAALLFVDESEVEILQNVHQFIILSALFCIPLTLVNVIRFCIQGMGFSSFAILAGVFEMAARTVVALIIVPQLGYFGACLANPFAWIAADLFLIPAFFYCYQRLKNSYNIQKI
jgi:putative MATE family efflux protein